MSTQKERPLAELIVKLEEYEECHGGDVVVIISGHPGENGTEAHEANFYIVEHNPNFKDKKVLRIAF